MQIICRVQRDVNKHGKIELNNSNDDLDLQRHCGVHFLMAIYCWAKWESMEKTIFSFALGFQLERASGLGPGCMSTSPFKSRTPCGADPCRPCAHCCNPCESMCASTVPVQRALPPQCLPALCLLSSCTSCSAGLSSQGGFGGSILFRVEGSEFPHSKTILHVVLLWASVFVFPFMFILSLSCWTLWSHESPLVVSWSVHFLV